MSPITENWLNGDKWWSSRSQSLKITIQYRIQEGRQKSDLGMHRYENLGWFWYPIFTNINIIKNHINMRGHHFVQSREGTYRSVKYCKNNNNNNGKGKGSKIFLQNVSSWENNNYIFFPSLYFIEQKVMNSLIRRLAFTFTSPCLGQSCNLELCCRRRRVHQRKLIPLLP